MKDQENIVLMDEHGNEEEFEVIATIGIKDNEYAILLPVSDQEDLEESAYIFRIDKEDDGEDILVPIEDDDEFDMVREAYEKLMEEESK